MNEISVVLDKIQQALQQGISDAEQSNRAAIVEILATFIEPDRFYPIIADLVNMLRFSYSYGCDTDRSHVLYVINFILGSDYKLDDLI